MTLTLNTYILYVLISLVLVLLVGNVLGKTSKSVFRDLFRGDKTLADNINRLILLGFYLLNIGYISLTVHTGLAIKSYEHMFEILSYKIGVILLVLGGFYFLSLWIMFKVRKRKRSVEDYVLSA